MTVSCLTPGHLGRIRGATADAPGLPGALRHAHEHRRPAARVARQQGHPDYGAKGERSAGYGSKGERDANYGANSVRYSHYEIEMSTNTAQQYE